MDPMTLNYYEKNAAELARVYSEAGTGISSWFERAFPACCRVLDVGASSGRDLNLLLEGGWDASGVEPCGVFLEEALKIYPRLDGRMFRDGLPALDTQADASFDGLLCAAVLMHLPEDELEQSVLTLHRLLRPGGRLLSSLPVDAGGWAVKRRESEGRLYNGLTPSRLEKLLRAEGFVLMARGRGPDSLERPERQWVTQLFVLETC